MRVSASDLKPSPAALLCRSSFIPSSGDWLCPAGSATLRLLPHAQHRQPLRTLFVVEIQSRSLALEIAGQQIAISFLVVVDDVAELFGQDMNLGQLSVAALA